jgi:hypothetical protein
LYWEFWIQYIICLPISIAMTSYYKTNKRNNPTDEQTEKLPLKSISGRRCLTKCYPKGEAYFHPVYLTGIINKVDNSCAIDPIPSMEPQHQEEDGMLTVDACRLADNKIYQPPDELESTLLSFYFNPRDFLANIYSLYSFDQVIYWTLENDYLPFDTVKRVHNCAWKVFGNKIEELSTGVLEYYFDISKTHWLRDYVKIIQNEYSFNLVTEKSTDKISNAFTETYNIIASRFYTYTFFINALKRYVYEFQDQWELIKSHYGNIKKYIFVQLIEHIENKLDENVPDKIENK